MQAQPVGPQHTATQWFSSLQEENGRSTGSVFTANPQHHAVESAGTHSALYGTDAMSAMHGNM